MIKSPERRKKERRAFRMVVLVTQIGICMMVPIFFCVFLGRLISEKTGQPLLFLLMLLIGILAGFRSSWQIISRFTGLTVRSLKGEDRASQDSSPGEYSFMGSPGSMGDAEGPETAEGVGGMEEGDRKGPYIPSDPEWEDDPPGSERMRP